MEIRILRVFSALLTLGVINSVSHEMYGYGYETANWKGVYVSAVKGGDGTLAEGLDGKYLEGKTKWGSFEIPSEMTFDFKSAQILTRYTFATVDWDEGAVARSPKAWKLLASNDAESWTLLDERTNGHELFTTKRQLQEFTFENKLSYKYYKFIFEKIISGTIMGLADINFPEFSAMTKPYFPKNDLTVVNEKLVKDADIAKATNNSIEVTIPVYSNKTTELGLVYSKEQSLPDLSTGSKAVGHYTKDPVYTTTITGLTSNTTYYVRPYAINEAGTGYGDVYTLTTGNDETEIFTTSFSAPDQRSSEQVNWNIGIREADALIGEYGIVWSQEGGATIESTNKYVVNTVSPGSTSFNAIMTNLEPHTVYYMRPYAKVNDMVTYGTECTLLSRPIEIINWKEGAKVHTDLTDDSYRWRNFLNKAFNGNLGNEFSSYANVYMLFSFEQPHVLNSYELANAQDADRYPKSWSLLASNDKQTWTTLDTQRNYAWEGNKKKGLFEFQNSAGYKYYKLDVTENYGGDRTAISHFDFPGYPNVVNSLENEKSAVKNFAAYANRQKQIVIANPDQELLHVTIFNSVGQKIHALKTDSEYTIVDQDFTRGVYLINIGSTTGRRINKLVIE